MTKNGIATRRLIRQEYLNPNQYTLTLLQEGNRTGLIAQEELEHVQSQFMALLAESIVKYTGGESTSVRTETAQRIMMSILYAVDAFLKSLGHPEDAAAVVKAGSIKEIYTQGLEILETVFRDTMQMYHEVVQNKLGIRNAAYHYTIDDLNQFFERYDMRFNARDIIASIDYPLLFDDQQVQGVYYIKQYLEKLDLENDFCRRFPSRDINQLLFNYGRVYRIDYRESLINAFEIVLNNCIFSVMTGGSAKMLSINRCQFSYLENKLKAMDYAKCPALVSASIGALLSELQIEKPVLKKYIHKYREVLMPRLENALRNDSLEHLVILDEPEPGQNRYILNEGKRMDDDSFRILVGEILERRDINQKIRLITTGTESLSDFIDLLEADCLYGDEYKVLFDSLGDLELSVLARIVFMEEIRSDPHAFSLLKVQEISDDVQWKLEYVKFLNEMEFERIAAIEQYLKQ